MMTAIIPSRLVKLLISTVCIAVLLPSLALAAVAGRLTKVSGRVDILHAGTAAAVEAKLNDELSIGDIVRTKSDGTAEITFIDNSVMSLGPRSRLGIEEYLYKSEENRRVASLKLNRGKAAFTIPKPVYAAEGSKFEMHTRTAVAGVRGTEGLLFTGPVERVYVSKGIVEFANPLGSVIVTTGNVGEVFYGRAPQVRPYSGTEFNKQKEGVKAAKPSEKQAAAGKTGVTTETTEAVESAPAATPAQATASQIAVSAATQTLTSQTLTTPPITAADATGKSTVPSTSTVNINPVFPGTTTGTTSGTGSTVNINVR